MPVNVQNDSPRTVEYVSIDDLLLDPQNPRFPEEIKGKNQNEILEWMILKENVTDLINSIGSQGYFPGEPLLVVEKNGNYEVVEGNRRTAALKLLNNPLLAKKKKNLIQQLVNDAEYQKELIPVLIYKKRNDILRYLGYRHVTGIKSWGPLEKARYLRLLLDSGDYDNLKDNKKYRELARTIGSNSSYVRKLLAGLNLYHEIDSNNFYDIDSLDEQTLSFSLITTAIGFTNIAQYIGLENSQDITQTDLNKENLETLVKWIFEEDSSGKTRLGESRNLQNLNVVLKNDTALRHFQQGVPLEKAIYYTDEPIRNYRKLIFEAKEKLSLAWETLAPLSVEELTEEDSSRIVEITNIITKIKRLLDH